MKNKKVIFLSLINITPSNIGSNNIYTSLLKKFINDGDEVYIVNPIEKRFYSGENEGLMSINGVNYLNIRIGNITKTNKIEKGISTLRIEKQYLQAIKKYLSDVTFDLILYPTPPITLCNVVEYIKERDGALAYLTLKDIFPQNAVDIEFFSKSSMIYKYFRKKEKKLYKISDYIGCMSKANVDYIINNNEYIDSRKVEIFPNSIEPINLDISSDEKKFIKQKYDLPIDKKIFLYGGNLGKPQGVEFLLKCIKSVKDIDDIFFLIIGNGTEYDKIVRLKKGLGLDNLKIMKRLEKEEFDKVAASSDIGILSLDHRFTIPNYPSRLLTYMQVNLPVLAITDPNTDVGEDILKGDFGWWCNKHSIKEFRNSLLDIIKSFETGDIENKSTNSYDFLKENFDVSDYYKVILEHLGS